MIEKGRLEELLQRAGRGDEAAFAELLEEYRPSLQVWIERRLDPAMRRRFGASDVLQSMGLVWWRAAPDFDFRDERAFASWLRTLAENVIRNREAFHRAARRNVAREIEPPETSTAASGGSLRSRAPSPDPSPTASARGNEVLARVEEVLSGLSAEDADAYREIRLRGRGVGEVARGKGVSRRTLERRLARAEEALRREFERRSR
jgi:RNA polymerase sigma factor (sigma-70 family)